MTATNTTTTKNKSSVRTTENDRLRDEVTRLTNLLKESTKTVSTVGFALTAAMEPVIACLDQHAPQGDGDQGFELPSQKDGLLRILLNNFCRDVYQQIHGVDSPNYKFAGVKDNWDRAQNAVAQLVNRYANSPEDLQADPNCARFYSWYEQSDAKMTFLLGLLHQFQECYLEVTGTQWEYMAPAAKAPVRMNAADAAAKMKELMSAGLKKTA